MGEIVNGEFPSKENKIKQERLVMVRELLEDALSVVEMIENGLTDGIPCEPVGDSEDPYALIPTSLMLFFLDEHTCAGISQGPVTEGHITAIKEYIKKMEENNEM